MYLIIKITKQINKHIYICDISGSVTDLELPRVHLSKWRNASEDPNGQVKI